MPDIFHDLPIKGPQQQVFSAVSTPEGLAKWWANRASGTPREGAEYELEFGAEYVWRCRVTKHSPADEFEIEMIDSDDDWNGTRVGFVLEPDGQATHLRFHHLGWPHANKHYRTSTYCWAMYLRCLKHYVERGVVLPYEDRFDG